MEKMPTRFDSHILAALDAYCESEHLSIEEKSRLRYILLSLIYGTVTLVGTGKCDSESAVSHIKSELAHILP